MFVIMKNKHMSFDDRLEIEASLKEKLSFKKIGEKIGKDATTISKEIKSHYKTEQKGAIGRPFFDCKYRNNCEFKESKTMCHPSKCSHYEQETCPLLNKAPYVCNGCSNRQKCTLEKHFYRAEYAQKEYESVLKESSQGTIFTSEEISHLDSILTPLLKDQGQSIHQAVINNKNTIMCSEKEIYNLIDSGVLNVRNIDLPRKVKFRNRSKKRTYYKIDKHCLEGRRYEDFQKYIKEHLDTPVVEMDTVEGVKGGKCLLTLYFVNCHFQLAFLRDYNDAQSVINIFNFLQNLLGLDTFQTLFVIILTDNGSEFSNPLAIELDPTQIQRTKIFYCELSRPDQKGHCENNHEFIRRILPKGTPFDSLTQKDIDLMMSHINSYKRKILNDCSPYQLFSLIYGKEILDKLNIAEIPSNRINLTTSLLDK